MSAIATMTSDVSKYRAGYSLSVGGVVLCDAQVLLVHRALGTRVGDWALPGGFVEQDETVHAAVRREVLEEAGVKAHVEGLIAVLNRVFDDVNDTYLIFLLTADEANARADGYEVDDARFFTLQELESLPRLQFISRMNIIPALQGNTTVLPFYADPFTPPCKGILYAAQGIRQEHDRTVRLVREGQVHP